MDSWSFGVTLTVWFVYLQLCLLVLTATDVLSGLPAWCAVAIMTTEVFKLLLFTVYREMSQAITVKLSYLVICILLLLNVGHQRVHETRHISHLLSGPLIHWAQVPLKTHTCIYILTVYTNPVQAVSTECTKEFLLKWIYDFWVASLLAPPLWKNSNKFLALTALTRNSISGKSPQRCRHTLQGVIWMLLVVK